MKWNRRRATSQIRYAYNGLGQLAAEYQEHTGAVNINTSPKVQYGYDSTTSGDRYSKGHRLAHRIWPNGRKIHSVYDGHSGIDDATSRVNKLAEDNGGIPGTAIVQYQFQGDGRAVRKEYPTPQVRLDLWGGTSGSYAGLDRFTRTIDHKWASYGGSDLDRFQHGYDNASNRLYRDNTLTADKDERYTYDNWHRLRSADRGQLSGGTITNPVREEDWTLNPLGNWDGYDTKANGTTDLSQSRSHSNANEITAITTSVGTAWATPLVSDLAGNMTTMPSGLDPTVALTASYDAWNRMIELRLSSDNSLVGSYGYDGAGRRISKTTLLPNETRHYYYTSQWQIVEERVGSSTTADRQYVQGLQYVDELCLRDRDTNADGSLDEHLYAMQDANWNVTAIVNPGGTVVERYQYDPYGQRTILDGSWSVLASSAYGWNIGHQGLYLDGEGGLYHNRARALHATLGRFVQRDPLGYVDGMSVYQYLRSAPVLGLDPLGTVGVGRAAQSIALAALRKEKGHHMPFLYYLGASVDKAFIPLTGAVKRVTVNMMTLGGDASYNYVTNTMSIRANPNELTVTHEAVHAADDLGDWSKSPEDAEGLAYGTEWLLAQAGLLRNVEVVGDCAGAQKAWSAYWKTVNTLGITVKYGWGFSRPLRAQDISNVKKHLGMYFSCEKLRPLYEDMLMEKGILLENPTPQDFRDFRDDGLPCKCRLRCPATLLPVFR